jgi:hypothetical protein
LKLYGEKGGRDSGVFMLRPLIHDKTILRVIAASGDGWDHVSVSTESRCPTWDEMMHVKELFFRNEEYAVQYCPPKSDHINVHPYCLHLWRDHEGAMPFPPKGMV